MSRSRTWTVGAALLALAVLAAGWFALIGPKRAEAADLQAQAVEQQEANARLQSKIKLLQTQAADLPAQQAKLAEIRTRIPESPALPALVRSLADLAQQAGVELYSLEPAAIEPVEATATTATATTTETPTTAEGAATDEAAPAAKPAPVPVSTLTAQPLSVIVVGSYFGVEQFLNLAEDLQRSFLVTGLTVREAEGDEVDAAQLGRLKGSTVPLRTAVFNARVFYEPAAAQSAPAQPVAQPAAPAAPAQ
jgi:Tfp pilus assembly protein PilO